MNDQQAVFDDLNDLRYFAMVVEYGGFSAAERISGIPKSRLSSRVKVLESRMGVRLLQRTTRHVSLTNIGSQFFAHCQRLLVEARAAQDVIDMASGAPRGLVRISCPVLATQVYIAPYLPQFMVRYPQVSVQVMALDRPVDLRTEQVDIALRFRQPENQDPDLISKPLGISRRILVASPDYLARIPSLHNPTELTQISTLHYEVNETVPCWELQHVLNGERISIKHHPALISCDHETVLQAAIQGMGIAMLPDVACLTALAQHKLCVVLPEWGSVELVFHLAFLTRRGMLPSVRALIDFLSENLPLIALHRPL
ncbi:D-malate degradation protein R [Serratia quinivorans]|uniref:LysR substrate-binding domain-containing protein n=1 Tax=Serratia quinivorans TaxID=137545 RepID=UPI000D89B14E|nr:LysR substrate-binding domain-containing protein [Serratia quinivorans]SPZ60705.1 D-malate degradation protein R [Serratia quinivorans]VEI65697.1 D-malate degradation protein R [Serratia quinivorans]